MGASTASRAASGNRSCPTGATATSSGDHWRLSPNQAKVTFNKITFFGSDGQPHEQPLSGCTATYDRSKASGTSLLDCPVSIPTGTITRMMVYYSTSFDIDVSDTTHCIFTDRTKASGFSATPPSNPADAFATFVATAQQNNNGDFVADILLPTPKTVASGDSPTLSIVTDMIHSMFATASTGGNAGDVLTYDANDVHAPVNVFATFGTAGKAEFYTPTATAENHNFASSTSESAVRIFYYDDATPGFEMNDFVPSCVTGNYPTQSTNANAATSGTNSSDGYKSGGYLGIDGSNVLAWALPTDFTYASYRSLLTMARVSTLGGTTTLNCKFLNGTAAPVPASGNVYSSNNAALISATSGTVPGETLVAH
jgi:hypothetical protein